MTDTSHISGSPATCATAHPPGLTGPGTPVHDLADFVRRRTVRERAEHRLPSLVLAVGRAGQLLHLEAAGMADLAAGRLAQSTTQYRLGSITKTFTAAVVLLLAERGRLDLDQTVGTHLPNTPLGRATLRQLLAHCGGVQREAPLPMWATLRGPDEAELLASLSRAEMVARPGERWHYSNLGYALLGQVVADVSGTSCTDFIDEQLIKPLGLRHTTWGPSPTAATGYRLDPYQDVAHAEPVMDQGAAGVGGQLWTTAEDVLVWADALTGGASDVLPETVTTAMHTLHVMTDCDQWTQGWGLGLILTRTGRGITSGHTGAMPGFLAALAIQGATRSAVIALTNVTRGIGIASLAADVLEHVLHYDPVIPDPGNDRISSQTVAPPHLDGVLGRWWSEAEETVFTWHGGALRALLATEPVASESIFVVEGADRYRASSGRFQGEQLLVKRDGAGEVVELEWATYPFTRTPR